MTVSVTGPIGVGALAAVPAASANGTALGSIPATASGVRLYLPVGTSLTFTIASSAPGSPPATTFQVSQQNIGSYWDEALSGQMLYVTAMSGTVLFRWI